MNVWRTKLRYEAGWQRKKKFRGRFERQELVRSAVFKVALMAISKKRLETGEQVPLRASSLRLNPFRRVFELV